jgi:hypothetical protein
MKNLDKQQQEDSGSETKSKKLLPAAWTLPSETSSKKFKKDRDDEDPESGAGLGPVGSSV